MSRRFPLAAALAALAILATSLLGAAAFWGVLPAARTPLAAELRLAPLVLPAGVEVEPGEVATFLSKRVAEQAERDVAIRMTMGEDNVRRMIDTAFPRLLTPGLLRSTFDRIPPLRSVLALSGFRSSARISVVNRGTAPLADIALTLPDAGLAELSSGEPLAILAGGEGPAALRLGDLAPGATLAVTAWRSTPLETLDPAEIRIAAAGGVRGDVAVYGLEGWLGEGLAAHPWARWLVGAVLLGVALAAFGALVAIVGLFLAARRDPASVQPFR